MHKISIPIPGKNPVELKPIKYQISTLWHASPTFKHAPEIARKAEAQAESVASKMPEGAMGLGAFIWEEGPRSPRLAIDAWEVTSDRRQLHTDHFMPFLRKDHLAFPPKRFHQTERTKACLERIIASQEKNPIIVVPIRVALREIEDPMMEGEFGLDLASGVYFIAAHSKDWQQVNANIEFACEGERFDEKSIPAVGFIQGDRRIRNLLPSQHEALSLTAFEI